MTRFVAVLLLAGAAPILTGCVAGMAVGAVGMAAGSGGSGAPPADDGQLQAEAREGCSAHASQHGSVQVNVVQQRSKSEVAVWGTVDSGTELRSFECRYNTKVDSFTLRAIAPAS